MEDNKDIKYWERFFQSLQMTYYSLLAAPLFLFAIAFLRAENGNNKIVKLGLDEETYLVVSVSVVSVVIALILLLYIRQKYKLIARIEEIRPKMNAYREATMTKYIVLCVLQLIVVIAYAATYHNGLMGLFTGLLLYASFFRPELQTAKRSLRMSEKTFRQIDYKTNILP
jgi:sterol desaturase/sphingolipid hydroxylase (fatty acid hydroxylase superfamily)